MQRLALGETAQDTIPSTPEEDKALLPLSEEQRAELLLLRSCGLSFQALRSAYGLPLQATREIVQEAHLSGIYVYSAHSLNSVHSLTPSDKLARFAKVYFHSDLQLSERAMQLILARVIAISHLREQSPTLDPYVMLVEAISPGTLRFMRQSLEEQVVMPQAVKKSLEWLAQAEFVEGEAILDRFVTTCNNRRSEIYGGLITPEIRRLIDQGLSLLENEVDPQKHTHWYGAIKGHFFGKLSYSQLAEQYQIRISRATIGLRVTAGVAWLRLFLHDQLGYGELENSIRGGMDHARLSSRQA